jgi:hypothetical protein
MNRREIVMASDRIWHLLIAHSFNHRCLTCGQPGTDPHHWCYIRSVHQYRWALENGVYMCRLCHNLVEQDPEFRAKLYLLIKNNFSNLWTWKNSQPPLGSRPIRTWEVTKILTDLQETAGILGVKR